jgi:hypothetical protein
LTLIAVVSVVFFRNVATFLPRFSGRIFTSINSGLQSTIGTLKSGY